jgi:hypothetical protein
LRTLRISAAVGTGFALWGLAVGLIPLHDNSFLTEVATGRLISATGIIHSDPYSFTAHGHPWVLESWLASVIYAWVLQLAGSHGLLVLHAALGTGLALLVWRLTRPAGTLVGRILAAAAALAVGTGYWSPRPLLMALVAMAVLILATEDERVPVWVVVPLMWLWVNVHGSWPLAILYLALRMAGRAVDGAPLGRLPRLAAAAAGGILLGALNPYGLSLLTYPLVVVTHHQAFAHIAEWQSPSFGDPVNAIFLGAALVTLAVSVRRRGRAEDALVVVAFLAAACLASRNVPVGSLVMVPAMSRAAAGLGSIEGARAGTLALAATGVLAVVGVALVGQAVRRPAFNFAAYPVAAVSWMQQHRMAPGRVATQDFVGNYLEYRYGPKASAFVDDRVDVYPSSVEHAYGVLLDGRPGWQSVLDRYHIDTVLWSSSQPLASLVEAAHGWRVMFRDHGWVVACRTAVA